MKAVIPLLAVLLLSSYVRSEEAPTAEGTPEDVKTAGTVKNEFSQYEGFGEVPTGDEIEEGEDDDSDGGQTKENDSEVVPKEIEQSEEVPTKEEGTEVVPKEVEQPEVVPTKEEGTEVVPKEVEQPEVVPTKEERTEVVPAKQVEVSEDVKTSEPSEPIPASQAEKEEAASTTRASRITGSENGKEVVEVKEGKGGLVEALTEFKDDLLEENSSDSIGSLVLPVTVFVGIFFGL